MAGRQLCGWQSYDRQATVCVRRSHMTGRSRDDHGCDSPVLPPHRCLRGLLWRHATGRVADGDTEEAGRDEGSGEGHAGLRGDGMARGWGALPERVAVNVSNHWYTASMSLMDSP